MQKSRPELAKLRDALSSNRNDTIMQNMNPLDAAISPIRLQLRALVEMQLIRAVFSGSGHSGAHDQLGGIDPGWCQDHGGHAVDSAVSGGLAVHHPVLVFPGRRLVAKKRYRGASPLTTGRSRAVLNMGLQFL